MNVDVKLQLLKFFFQLLNLIFLVLGLSVGAFGLWVLFDRGNLLTVLPSDELRTVGAGLSLIGVVVVGLSVIGCVAGSKLLLLTYLGFLIVLVLGQLFTTLLLLISRNKIERSLDATIDDIIIEFTGNGLIDRLQRYEECCGWTGPSDWLNNSYLQSLNLTNPDVLPCSCFRSYLRGNTAWCSELLNYTSPLYGRGNSSHEEGCKMKAANWLRENILTVVGMAAGLMLIQLLQFVLAVSLYRTISRKPSGPDSGELNFGYMDDDDDDDDDGDTDHDDQNY